MSSNFKPVIVIGAANFDIKGKSLFDIVSCDSNPCNIKMSSGGVGRNITENLVRLGINTVFLSCVGNDFQGKLIIHELEELGLDTQYIMKTDTYKTGTYIAILDNKGEMYVALSSMEINNLIDINYINKNINIIKDAYFIIVDNNLEINVINYIISITNKYNIPIFVEPVSTIKSKKLISNLSGIDYITPNLAELKVLANLNDDLHIEKYSYKLLKEGVKNVIVTMGSKGIYFFNERNFIKVPAVSVEISDVTGAGDSFTAGFIYGLYNKYDVKKSIKCGIITASLTLGSKYTVSPKLTKEKLEELTINS